MAIALDVADAGTNFENASGPGTLAHTNTGSNRLLLVGVGASTDVVTGVTYAGSTMSKLVDMQQGDQGHSYIYGLIAPNTGANDIVVSWTGLTYARIGGVSYTGVQQSGLPDATVTRDITTGTTQITGTVTTVADPTWAMAVTRDGGAAMSAGANQTLRVNLSAQGVFIGDTNGSISPAQAFAMTTNQTGTSTMSIILASFADVTQIGAGGAFRSLLGVGQ